MSLSCGVKEGVRQPPALEANLAEIGGTEQLRFMAYPGPASPPGLGPHNLQGELTLNFAVQVAEYFFSHIIGFFGN